MSHIKKEKKKEISEKEDYCKAFQQCLTKTRLNLSLHVEETYEAIHNFSIASQRD